MLALVSSDDLLLQLAAIRSMRDGASESRQAMINEVLRQPSEFGERAQCEAIMALSPSDAAQREMLIEYAGSAIATIREEALRTLRGTKLLENEHKKLAESLDRHKQSASAEAIAAQDELLALIEPREFPPIEDHTVASIAAWMQRLTGPADPLAGERVFFNGRVAGCARCHQIEGRGGRIGPDLSTTAQVLDRRRLIESILAPSKEIAPRFVAWTIQTTDGRLLTGLLIGEGLEGDQTYADSQGKTFTLKPDEIELREPHGQSLMPAGLERNLTLQEFRDLLAFLQSRR
jgi:putative heme-binding domain-containing protein